MFDLAMPLLDFFPFLLLEWWQWVLVICLIVIIVAYMQYRKKQV